MSGNSSDTRNSQRTISGVLVHILGLFLGLFGAVPVYLLSNAAFTEANAKNALNWQVFVLATSIVFGAMAFGLKPVSDVFVILAAFGILLLGILDIVFCFWATVEAIGGTEWTYPITPEFF